jgi:hypothetical protein
MHKFLLILSQTFYHHLVKYSKLQPPHHSKNVPWFAALPLLPQTSPPRSPPLPPTLTHNLNSEIVVLVMEEALVRVERYLRKDERALLLDSIHYNVTVMRGGAPITKSPEAAGVEEG